VLHQQVDPAFDKGIELVLPLQDDELDPYPQLLGHQLPDATDDAIRFARMRVDELLEG